MRLNTRAFALTCGIVWGAAVMLATWWLLIFGYQGQVMSNLDHFYFGYSFSYAGAVVGGIWAGAVGLYALVFVRRAVPTVALVTAVLLALSAALSARDGRGRRIPCPCRADLPAAISPLL